MPPPKSIGLQIGEYIVAQAIANVVAGATYNYTPNFVKRVPEPLLGHWEEGRQAPYNASVLWLVFKGESVKDTLRTTKTLTKEAEIGIIAARRADLDRQGEGADSPFNAQTPQREEVVENLFRDVEILLRKDAPQLTDSRLAYDLETHQNHHYYLDGWDCAHTVVFFKYTHHKDTP